MSNLIKKINYLEFCLEIPEQKFAKIELFEKIWSYEIEYYSKKKNVDKVFQTISNQNLKNLLISLNNINFQKWKKIYKFYKIDDPILWSFTIQYNDNKTVKYYSGINEFPITDRVKSPIHAKSSTSYTPEFIELMRTLNLFIGKNKVFE